MATQYRVAVIGRTGRGDYGHGLDVVWKDFPGVRIVAVADEDEKGRQAAAKRLNAPQAYADYREMLDKERPHIVSVAPRWLDCHRDMVIACAEHGCHVFLEKPMARTLEEADAMVSACERAHVKLAIAHQIRYSPRLDRAKELIADGKLGKLLEVRGRGKEDHRGGGEDMMVLGTHIMDLMRLVGGDPKWCFARVTEGDKPIGREQVREGAEGIGPLAGDEVHSMYHLSGRAMGYFDSHCAKDGVGERWGLRLYGSKGMITVGKGSMPAFPEVFFIDDPAWAPGMSKASWVRVTGGGLGKPETATDTGPQVPGNLLIARDLIRAIEADVQPKGSMYDGRAALEMIMAVYASQRLGGLVPLPLTDRRHPLLVPFDEGPSSRPI